MGRATMGVMSLLHGPAALGIRVARSLYSRWRLLAPDQRALLEPHAEHLKKSALEGTIQRIAEEVHRQYVVSFTPPTGSSGEFHSIRVAVKNRPELAVRTRAGYWALPEFQAR